MAKWVTLQVLHERAPTLANEGLETTVQSLLDLVSTHSVDLLNDAKDLSSVEFTTEWLETLRSRVRQRGAGLDDLFDEIVHRLTAAGSLAGDLTSTVFSNMVALARAAYADHGVSLPSTDLHFDVTWDGPILVTLPNTYVTARTNNAKDHYSVVVELPISGMNVTMFSSLEYVLLHECVCHVFRGPFDRTKPDSSPNSPFQEGWMDFASLILYEDHLVGLPPGPPCLSSALAGSTTLRREAARQAHRDRRRRDPQESRWAARELGADAAERLESAMQQLPDFAGNARRDLLRLSLSLNASGLPVGKRDTLAFEVRKQISDWRLSNQASVFEALRSWRDSGNVESFVSCFV